MAKENDEFTRRENIELIHASFGSKATIAKLNDERSKLTEQNEELVIQLEDCLKCNQNAQGDKKKFESQISLLKDKLSKESQKLTNLMKEKEKIEENKSSLKLEMDKMEANYYEEKNDMHG